MKREGGKKGSGRFAGGGIAALGIATFAIVLALLAFAATQFLLYWGENVDVKDGGSGTLVFVLAVASAVILVALAVRAFRYRPEAS